MKLIPEEGILDGQGTGRAPVGIGYCTNVHAGHNLDEYWHQLRKHSLAVKARVSPQNPLPIGLWFSECTARELLGPTGRLVEFRDWLSESGLVPYTLNGFPQGDFHGPIVKHAVYQPTWLTPQRVDYTCSLVDLLDQLLPAGAVGTISTLPIAWGTPSLSPEQFRLSAINMAYVVRRLAELEARTGRLIVLCVEPEPGCALQYSEDIVRYFQIFADASCGPDLRRRYLGVCHDICHAAVMFETQQSVLQRYADAEIRVGKVQVSSALEATFGAEPMGRSQLQAELSKFAEDRYLHQTCCLREGEPPHLFEDLSAALAARQHPQSGEVWRVHYHVPIYCAELGGLRSTQADIGTWAQLACSSDGFPHLEVETYAWNVLPSEFRPGDLAAGISKEIRWLHELLGSMKTGVVR